jgi:hypothetical protein
MWYNGGPKPDDVVDVGEELRKGALKAWRKVRGGRSESPAAKAEGDGKGAAAAPQVATESPVAGDATPRRAGSPDHAARTSKDEAHPPEGGQPHSYHLADGDDHTAEGARTPRNGMTRRLSTGAFLGNASLRGMQDDRRKKVLGLDGGDDEDEDEEEARGKRENARFAESLGRTNAEHLVSKTGSEHWHPGLRHARAEADARKVQTVTPDAETSDDLSVDSERDDDVDDEETREAERLAAAAADRPTTKAGGLEKFEKHTG